MNAPLRQPIQAPALADEIRTAVEQDGRPCSPELAERAASVIRAFPNHWRDWRPEDPWDRSYDVLIRWMKILDQREANELSCPGITALVAGRFGRG